MPHSANVKKDRLRKQTKRASATIKKAFLKATAAKKFEAKKAIQKKVQDKKTDAAKVFKNYILCRHAESLANLIYAPISQAHARGEITDEEKMQKLLKEFLFQPEFQDSSLSQKGLDQTRNAQAQLNSLKMYKKVFVSPQVRTVQTVTTLLEKHPQKSEICLVLVPRLKEISGAADTTPKPLANLKLLLNKTGFHYDMSLIEEYGKHQEQWGFCCIEDEVTRDKLLENVAQSGGNHLKAVAKYAKEHGKGPEPDKLVLARAKKFNQYIPYACGDAKPDEHVLIVAHGMLLGALTCEGVQEEETFMGHGFINPNNAVQTNCKPTHFTFDMENDKWIQSEDSIPSGL